VAGGGDSAMEEATFLTRFGRTVTVIHRRDRLRASKIMQERAFANPKIKFRWNSEVTEILGEEKITGLRLRDTVTGRESTLEVGGLFVAIGHDPRSGLFTGQLATDDEGYLLVGQPSTRTAIPGVFACGDVVDRTYRQAVTAAGTGCAAALDAGRFPRRRDEPSRHILTGASRWPGRCGTATGRARRRPAAATEQRKTERTGCHLSPTRRSARS